jgi:hypothetical protein
VQPLQELNVHALVGDPVRAALWMKPDDDHFLPR